MRTLRTGTTLSNKEDSFQEKRKPSIFTRVRLNPRIRMAGSIVDPCNQVSCL